MLHDQLKRTDVCSCLQDTTNVLVAFSCGSCYHNEMSDVRQTRSLKGIRLFSLPIFLREISLARRWVCAICYAFRLMDWCCNVGRILASGRCVSTLSGKTRERTTHSLPRQLFSTALMSSCHGRRSERKALRWPRSTIKHRLSSVMLHSPHAKQPYMVHLIFEIAQIFSPNGPLV